MEELSNLLDKVNMDDRNKSLWLELFDELSDEGKTKMLEMFKKQASEM